jgi:hypothetical protein
MAAAARFRGKVRYFRPELKAGLAVVDIPKAVAAGLGGLKQMRVRGRLNGMDFNSNTMPAGGGVLALSLSQRFLALRVSRSATRSTSNCSESIIRRPDQRV